MSRFLLKSRIHRVAATHCDLHPEALCTIDEDLTNAAKPGEQARSAFALHMA